MSAVSLPITFTALAVREVAAPLSAMQCTVSSLASDELLVRISYASLNAMDPVVQHSNLFQKPLPFRIGFDFSGQVVAEGAPGELQVGDDVFGFTSFDGGCLAEYLVVKRERAALRGSIPAREAGAYGIAYPSAYDPIVTVGKVADYSGQWAFVPGGAGGVSHFGVQICRAHGLKVISSAGKTASLSLLRQMGCEEVLDYRAVDVVQEVLRVTGGAGAAFVFDGTCRPSSFVQSASCVARGGVLVKLGLWEHTQGKGRECQQIAEQRGATFVIGNHDGLQSNACMKQAVQWYESDRVKPYVTREVRFDAAEVQAAVDGVGAGEINVGKVVVHIGA